MHKNFPRRRCRDRQRGAFDTYNISERVLISTSFQKLSAPLALMDPAAIVESSIGCVGNPTEVQVVNMFGRKDKKTRRIALLRMLVLCTMLFTVVGCNCAERPERKSPQASCSVGTEKAIESEVAPLDEAGLPNAYKVTENLYRGAQPTEKGMRKLFEMGIKTVINLRTFHSDRDELGDLPLEYEHIEMQAWDADIDEIVAFLKVATDPDKQPVFVHCQHGADRTGVCVAVYRSVVCGWSKEKAIREMTSEKFGYHEIWDNLIERIEQLDVDQIKRKAGLSDYTAKGSKAPESD